MAHVAERSGVAVQTMYFVFHTKAELLSRAHHFAVMGEVEPRILRSGRGTGRWRLSRT